MNTRDSKKMLKDLDIKKVEGIDSIEDPKKRREVMEKILQENNLER